LQMMYFISIHYKNVCQSSNWAIAKGWKYLQVLLQNMHGLRYFMHEIGFPSDFLFQKNATKRRLRPRINAFTLNK
jgi:hypothetical protein